MHVLSPQAANLAFACMLNCCRAEVVDYYMLRCRGNYQMLEKLNVIGRTSEFARLYGIEFENVLTRGSQVY